MELFSVLENINTPTQKMTVKKKKMETSL